MLIILIMAAATAAATPTAGICTARGSHPAAVLKYICDSERAWAESVATGDSSAVKRILADDFIGVDPSGKMYDKKEMVADTAKGGQYFASNIAGDVLVRFYGDTAIAQGSEQWTRKTGETGRWVWTDTWLKRHGKWQIVAAEDLNAKPR